MSDVITLTVGGQAIGGWTDVRITRGCEQVTGSFELGLTSTNPDDGSQVVAQAGQACTVQIGGDVVVTGWIDRDTNLGDARTHRLGIVGRGWCGDLVDCSAEWKGGQISGDNALQVATKLARPYGVSVSLAGGADPGPAIPQFNLNFGETAWDIVERVTRYAGLLTYEDTSGNLVLSQVGTLKAASGAVYGQNVQAWSVVNSMEQRYSDYVCSLLSIDTLGDIGDGGLLYDTEHDPSVPRHRLMYLVTEQISGGQDLCVRRAKWEAARRFGRGTSVQVTVDSWRDSAGALWAPNTLAPVKVPGLRYGGADPVLCISQVSFRYEDGGGTAADLTLMPREAFALEPLVIQPTPFATGEAQ